MKADPVQKAIKNLVAAFGYVDELNDEGNPIKIHAKRERKWRK